MQIVFSLFPQRYNPSAIAFAELKIYPGPNWCFKRKTVRNVNLDVSVENMFVDLIGFK